MRVYSNKEKRNLKILSQFNEMVSQGTPKMEAYKALAKKYKLTVSGARYAVLSAKLIAL